MWDCFQRLNRFQPLNQHEPFCVSENPECEKLSETEASAKPGHDVTSQVHKHEMILIPTEWTEEKWRKTN